MGDTGLIAIEQKGIETVVKNEICSHTFISGSAAHLDDALRLETDHGQHVEDDPIFFKLRINAKTSVLNIWIQNWFLYATQCN